MQIRQFVVRARPPTSLVLRGVARSPLLHQFAHAQPALASRWKSRESNTAGVALEIRRGFAAAANGGEPAPDDRLSVGAETNVAALGGAIAHRIRRQSNVTLRSIGEKAAYRSVKAAVCAGEYLQQDDGAPPDRVVAMRVNERGEDMDVGASGESQVVRRTVMQFDVVSWRKSEGTAVIVQEDVRTLIVSAKTNAGKAAAAIASAVRAKAGSAEVRAMGATAVSQALASASVAQQYLDSDGRGLEFVVVPRFDEDGMVESTGGESETREPTRARKQLVLEIIRSKGQSAL